MQKDPPSRTVPFTPSRSPSDASTEPSEARIRILPFRIRER